MMGRGEGGLVWGFWGLGLGIFRFDYIDGMEGTGMNLGRALIMFLFVLSYYFDGY